MEPLLLLSGRARYSVRSLKARLAIGADLLRYQASLGAGRQSTWLSEYLEANHGELTNQQLQSLRKQCIRDMQLFLTRSISGPSRAGYKQKGPGRPPNNSSTTWRGAVSLVCGRTPH